MKDLETMIDEQAIYPHSILWRTGRNGQQLVRTPLHGPTSTLQTIDCLIELLHAHSELRLLLCLKFCKRALK